MDSLTQAALGAAVGVAVMGRHRPAWQAALAGAVIGTLPDLDVFIDKGDAIDDMVLHRAETHALFWQALASPLIALIPAGLTRSRALFGRWWLLAALVLFTHTLLDALTIYGTRLALPFSDYPFGLGSLFIIDPLYTLPLLIGLLATLAGRSPRRLRRNAAGLLLSTVYAGWAVAAQAHVTGLARNMPEAQGLGNDRILVTPTPFNTLLWRIVLVHDERYHEGFHSLFDRAGGDGPAIRFETFARGAPLEARTAGFAKANTIRAFSKGFYALSDDGRYIRITDLRMGQHPYYAFSFAFAEHQSEPLRAITPFRIQRRVPLGPGLGWLWERLPGKDAAPPR